MGATPHIKYKRPATLGNEIRVTFKHKQQDLIPLVRGNDDKSQKVTFRPGVPSGPGDPRRPGGP